MLMPRVAPRAVDASIDPAGRLNLTVGARDPVLGPPAEAVVVQSGRTAGTAPAVGPSTAGLVTVAILAGLAIIGGLLTARRRLDPTLRAETTVFDRAGLASGDRRVLRRAARRLSPPVPAVSLLLAEGLLDQAVDATPSTSPDVARLVVIARRQFGERPAAESTEGRVRNAIRPSRTVVAPEDAHRTRAASRLAIALEMAAVRRSSFDGGSPGSG